jgi:phosphoenolpyruvate-protein kinase (PTS system EI component)
MKKCALYNRHHIFGRTCEIGAAVEIPSAVRIQSCRCSSAFSLVAERVRLIGVGTFLEKIQIGYTYLLL